jgi:hypothetical protein
LFVCAQSQAAVVSIVGTRAELDTIRAGFLAQGDTVNEFDDWASLSAAQLDAVFSADVVWEGDIFNGISAGVQTRMIDFVNSNRGLFLTGERSCCEGHNAGVQNVGRTLTGDAGLLVGGLGFDLFNHAFSNSPTTILTAPNDIRGQAAQHNGPGRVSPTGGVDSDACFVVSSSPETWCSAAAWGPDRLANSVGRLVIYGDINSQPSLVNNFGADQFENIRQFLLAGFSGGEDSCIRNPNLPGCNNNQVPEPTTLGLLGLGLLAAGVRRRRKA